MGDVLRGLGFTVIEVRNGNKAQMAAAITQVQGSLKGKQGVGMLYYAGHGLQMDARNFMVPVDAKLTKGSDVALQTVDVGSVVEAFKSAGNRMNILVLDACRDNPFGGITTGKGLAPLDAPSGTFLAYATAPGNVAEDGDAKGGNGLYTQFLLQELKKPQARIEDVFKRVRFNVRQQSQGRQIPWESTSLEDDFQFNNGRVTPPAPKPSVQQLQAEFSQEKADWDRIKESKNTDDFYAFLQKYPNGIITESVHARLNHLSKVSLKVQGAGADGKDLPYVQSRFRLGDEYEQRQTIQVNNQTIVMTTIDRVTKVEPDRIEVLMEYPTQKIPSTLKVYNGSGEVISVGDIVRWDPPQATVPGGLLQVGQSWKAVDRSIFTSAMKVSLTTTTSESRVIAREKVSVPAGSFDTFRIKTTSRSLDAQGDQPGSDTDVTAWLSPDLPIPLRVEINVGGAGPMPMKTVTETIRIVRGP